MLPLYAMFPFKPKSVVPGPAFVVLALVCCGAVVAVVQARHRSRMEWHRPCRVRDWVKFLLCLVVPSVIALIVAVVLNGVEHDQANRTEHWLLISYIVLTLDAVVLTAVALGQSLRLQVAVQTADGATDAVATEYLLARM